MSTFIRSFPLNDIAIRKGGDGRTVEAYAAVFGRQALISDQQGRYREQIHRSSFERTVSQRGTKFGVFYNHGMTLHGTPSEMASVPLGSPVEAPRADGSGLITVSRYNRTPLADQILESIRNGDITGQSFSGRFIRSDPMPPQGGKYRASRDGEPPLVTRMEIAMTEYGPTPIPAYDEPMVLGVRAALLGDPSRVAALSRVRAHFTRATLAPAETETLTSLLAMLAGADGAFDPIVDAICGADMALDAAQMVVSAMLAVPDPDLADEGDDPGDGTTPNDGSGPGRSASTATTALASQDPHATRVHSGGITAAQRARIGLLTRGIR